MAGHNQNSNFERKEPKFKAPPAPDPVTGVTPKVRGGGPLVRGYVESDDVSIDCRRCTHESPYTGHRCAAYCVKGARVCAYHGGGTEKWIARIEGRYSDIFGDGASKLRDQYHRPPAPAASYAPPPPPPNPKDQLKDLRSKLLIQRGYGTTPVEAEK